MARNFPKLNTSGEFPGVSNIDVYAYDNAFDYSRYDAAQMELTVCTVPWDMGEAHVGQRTITGIGNVVHFGSKANRDAYFTAIPDNECFRWTTKYKELHRDKAIDVPLPFDVAARFNYLKVHYDLFANDDSPIMYESATGLLDWFWFVREVEFIAPNTTRLHLLNDAWQTFIYDFEIDEMILERGHAPMYELTANDYLANPIGNCSDLLAEDVSFGEPRIVAGTSEFVFNSGTMCAVIVTTANPVSGTWGTKAGNDWKTPGKRNFTIQGNPTYCAFAIPANALSTFLTAVENTSPQFMQTLKGVYLVAQKLITLGSQFDFCGQTCNLVSAGYIENNLLTLGKSMFGYDAAYADIAKLYTYPYAYLTVTDENGNGYDVRIEDTDGSLQLESCVSLAYPWLNITGHILGIGKVGRRNVTFSNLANRSIPIQGNWAQTLMKWEIPVYGISQDAESNYDFASDFERRQATLSANNAYDSSVASANASQTSSNASASTAKTNADQSARATRDSSYDNADTAKTNADRSADTAKANADASADTASTNATNTANTLVSNSQLQVATNGAINTASKTSADSQYTSTMTYNTGLAAANNVLVDLSATSTIGAADQQASISAISGGITAAAGVGASIASMDITGAVNGIVNGIVGSASTLASNSVATALTAANAGYTKAGNTANATASNAKSDTDRNIQKTFLDAQTTAQNALTTGSAANSSATTIVNAGNENATAKANALRSQSASKDNAILDKNTSRNNALRSYELARGGNSTGYDYGDGVNERTYDTAIANAARMRDTTVANAARTRDTTLSAITNGVSQAALGKPLEFGEFANGDTSTTRPMGVFANVVTQDDYCISRAGDEFLRYGYAYGKRWSFDGNWNVCDRFTYWKLADFWIKNLNIPDMYCDQLRFFLFGGVTVWRNPSDIGRISIYQNGF